MHLLSRILFVVSNHSLRFTAVRMATFRVHSGLSSESGLPDSQVVLIGKYSLLKSIQYDDQLANKLKGVEKSLFENAVKRLQSGGSSIPLHLDLAKLISVSDETGRYNAPSNSIAIYKELRGLPIANGVTKLNIILYAEYENVFSSVSAASRVFPTYSRKTGNKSGGLETVQLEIVVTNGKKLTEKDVLFLQTLSDSIRSAQYQIDAPCNEFHSEAFAADAERLVDALSANVKKTFIKGEDLLKKGFGGIYHVGKAARHPPIFACFSYTPSSATESYALVGKGIVYDTGGMQIKTKTGMPSMKIDMAGAAGLLAAFCTLVKSDFKQNLHCLLCIAENNISPDANRPDDVIKMLSGKTVEINNTDAEGRLVLSDGVWYAKNELKCQTIIDMATLTGAQSYASGKYHASILCNSEAIEQSAVHAGKKSGDLVHPLIYAPELHFASNLKSAVADMKNTNLGSMDGPPSAIAGLFIGSHIDFSSDVEWIHIDMASPASTNDRATGYGPSLVCAMLAKHTDVDVAK
ncbi:CYTOSOL-AP domain-containing protein [Aphelenchoides besseyi]|nr:CYTOSOL-AP domain-containing protein [Aphelenchoides besseyi]